MADEMQFVSALAIEDDGDRALEVVIDQIGANLSSTDVDFLLVTLSSDFALKAGTLADRLRQALTPQVLIGCTAEGGIGRDQEVEQEPAIAAVAARLPNVTLSPGCIPDLWSAG